MDPENPIAAHESDCHVFYVFNYPMTCGEELVFNPGNLACEPAENVADSRPECASASGTVVLVEVSIMMTSVPDQILDSASRIKQ